MKSNELQKWQRKRALGKKTYVLRYGVLYFGMIGAVLTSLLELALSGKIDTAYLVARFVVFPLLGMMWTSMKWESNEKKYAMAVEQAVRKAPRQKAEPPRTSK
ncbi:hypothetical protein [Paenibacillus sp. MBLB4367]|uniref:hypothetical protein n=1 Tax=Paenibacillus sp. MBLB4367 TaxID=3384767 RepID=UPI0039081520